MKEENKMAVYGLSAEQLERLVVEDAKLWLDSGALFGDETALFERFNIACPRAVVRQALQQLKQAFEQNGLEVRSRNE